MQVKKFEAPTMKEALEMVKSQLGPEAIILNAKDNSKGFGLVGRQSIEITAAISEKQLLKKQWAESRLKGVQLEKLKSKTAKYQKEFIEKSVNRYLKSKDIDIDAQAPSSPVISKKEQVSPRPLTLQRYIEIDNSEAESQSAKEYTQAKGRTVADVLREIGQSRTFVAGETSTERVRAAAKTAFQEFEKSNSSNSLFSNTKINSTEVDALKKELEELKIVIRNLSSSNSNSNTTYELKTIYDKLIQTGIDERLARDLVHQAQTELDSSVIKKSSLVEGFIAKKIMNDVRIQDSQDVERVQMFLGPAGSGKSTHLVKLASYYSIQQNKKVGILTLDTEKVGASEQLRIYSQILNVPFGIIRNSEDWNSVQSALNHLDYILIDCPASSLRELNEVDKIKRLMPPEMIACTKHLVLSATMKDVDALEIVERYRVFSPNDLVVNKLDEAFTHGLIYNINKKFSLPLFSFGVGPKLPEDFEFATRERVIDLIFKITKFKSRIAGV